MANPGVRERVKTPHMVGGMRAPEKTNAAARNSTTSFPERVLQLHQSAGNQAIMGVLSSGIIQREFKRVASEGGNAQSEAALQAESSLYLANDGDAQLRRLEGSGRPLEKSERTFFEPRFGRDFSNVRLHTDSRAAEVSNRLNARALTSGRHIYWGAGQFAPHTHSGKHLLGHELAHVVQQSRNADARRVQRSVLVNDPNVVPSHLNPENPTDEDAEAIPAEYIGITAGQIVVKLFHQLSGDDVWEVSNGAVQLKTDHGTFCDKERILASSHPYSNACLCDVVGSGQPYTIHIVDTFIDRYGNTRTMSDVGEGRVSYPENSGDNMDVFISGRKNVGIRGFGGTSPEQTIPSGQDTDGPDREHQVLQNPPWLVLGHELCGHGRANITSGLGEGQADEGQFYHETTEEGHLSAVDTENLIRREHSTIRSSYGIRIDTFQATNYTQAAEVSGGDLEFYNYYGSTYTVKSGDTLGELARRFGIPFTYVQPEFIDTYLTAMSISRSNRNRDILKGFFRSKPDDTERIGYFVHRSNADDIDVGEVLFVEGVFWHRVIMDENLQTISSMWGIPEASLERANPGIGEMAPGDVLLIPAS